MTSFAFSRTRVSLLLLGVFILALLAGCAGSKQTAEPEERKRVVYNGDKQRSEKPSDKVIDYVIAASVAESQGDYFNAAKYYTKALAEDSSRVTIYLGLADSYKNLGGFENALTNYQYALELEPENTEILQEIGELQFDMGRHGDAFTTFRKLVDLDPDNAAAWYTLASLYIRLGNTDAAVDAYDRVMEIDGLDMDLLVRQATILSMMKRNERAIQTYQRMAELEPSDELIPFTIGGLYLEMGDTLSADSAFGVATELAPDSLRFWIYRIQLSHMQGLREKSDSLVNEAMTHLSDDPDFLGYCALLRMEQDRDDEAEQLLLDMAELDTTSVEPWVNLGHLHHEAGDWEAGAKAYEKGLEIDPDDALLNNNYAYLLAEWGREYEKALDHVELALEQEPNNASYLDTKGWLMYRMGRYEQALEYIQRANEQADTSAEILDHLGDVYAAMGERDKAREMWLQALEIGGDDEAIREKLESSK